MLGPITYFLASFTFHASRYWLILFSVGVPRKTKHLNISISLVTDNVCNLLAVRVVVTVEQLVSSTTSQTSHLQYLQYLLCLPGDMAMLSHTPVCQSGGKM